MKGPLAIVGYMGSGKSAVGRMVAEWLGWEFVDLDADVARFEGKSIPDIFAAFGEHYFRDVEYRLLRALLESETRERVIACGGGVVTHAANRQLLREFATVFLEEDTGVLFERTRGGDRPLRGADRDEFEWRYRERLPLYTEVADFTVHARGRPARRVAREVLRRLRSPGDAWSRRGRWAERAFDLLDAIRHGV